MVVGLHTGIYENDEKVIHFTSSLALSSIPPETCSRCREAMRGGGVIICCLNCFLEGNSICLFIYSVPWWFYNLSNIGVQDTCSMEDEDPPETVLHRANNLRVHGFGSYNLALRNCFDFAFYCKTGHPYFSLLEMVVEPSAVSESDLRRAIRRWLFWLSDYFCLYYK